MALIWLHIVDRVLFFRFFEDSTCNKLCGMQLAMGKIPVDVTGPTIIS